MGRGDNRTKKGKISSGSFGVSRPAKTKKSTAPVEKAEKPEPKAKKAAAKKKEEE